jgi:Flp pilus assembly protein TadG
VALMRRFSRLKMPRRSDRGVAAVEFALLLPILLVLTLGAIDWGYFLYVKQRVVNAAREGARAGTLVDPSSDNDPLAAAEAAAGAYLAGVGLTAQGVDADFDYPGGTKAVKVTITYPAGSLSGYLSSFVPANATGVSVMRWE